VGNPTFILSGQMAEKLGCWNGGLRWNSQQIAENTVVENAEGATHRSLAIAEWIPRKSQSAVQNC